MNAEFVKALLAAGPVVHAVGLVINVDERYSLNIQLMIGLLHELKIDLKHVVIIFTHGNTLLQNPTTMKLEERCTKRCQLLPQHIENLECLVRLLADVNNRFLVVENVVENEQWQLSERDTIALQLFERIDSIAADPMTNHTFCDSLQWWNEQQARHRREERELTDAKDWLANLQAERANKDLERLRSEHRCLEGECSNLSSKLDKMREIKEMLVGIRQIESETDQCTADNEAVKEELRRVKEEESVLQEQEETLQAFKDKFMQKFDETAKNYTDTLNRVIANRDEGIVNFENVADEIDEAVLRATAAKIAGFGASILGGAIFTVGAGLLMGGITAAAGIPLMAVGGVVGGAGSVTAVGGSIGQMVEKSKKVKQAKEWLKVNKTMCQELIKAYEVLTEEHAHIVELFPCINASLPSEITDIGEIVNTWKDISQHSAEDAGVLLAKAASSGLGLAQGVIEGIDVGAEVAALSAKAGVKAAGGVAIGLSGLVMIVDFGFLVKSSYDLHKLLTGNRTKLASTLMELAGAVREENNLLREASRAARSKPIDDPNGILIRNPLICYEEQLLDSLEPRSTIEVECHTNPDAHAASTQDEGWDHDANDVPISLAAEAGENPSTHTMQRSTDSVSTFQMSIHADSDTTAESDTDNMYPEILARIDSHDASQTDTSETSNRYCVVS